MPRYHHQWYPDAVDTEKGALPADVVVALRAMGHTVTVPGENNDGRRSSDAWGNLNTVLWDRRGNALGAGTDPRSNVGKAAVSTKP